MALWTYVDHHHMVLVPPDTVIEDGVVTPRRHRPDATTARPRIRQPAAGVIFVVTLLVVAVLGNVWIRALAVVAAALIAVFVLLVSWDWWGRWSGSGCSTSTSTWWIPGDLHGPVRCVVSDRVRLRPLDLPDLFRGAGAAAGRDRRRRDGLRHVGGVVREAPYDYFRWLVGLRPAT
jgi:hypothetical protein